MTCKAERYKSEIGFCTPLYPEKPNHKLMKEQIKEILNQNGYALTDETTLLEMAEIINRHKKIMELLEEAMIDIPQKRKTLEL